MRRYVVIRTDKNNREAILRELEQGRLRQGWGWNAEHDLKKLRAKINAGHKLVNEEPSVWRNRRLLDTEADGLKPGDVVVLPNLPELGRWTIATVSGPYSFAQADPSIGLRDDYRHIVPVKPFLDQNNRIVAIHPNSGFVDARLRATMRNLSRMWSIDSLGNAVERIISAIRENREVRTPQPETTKFETFVSGVKVTVRKLIRENYTGAEFEQLVLRLLQKIYHNGRVEHWGGRGEKGADLIVFTPDPLGLEYKIAVQVKQYDGVIGDLRALDQIQIAHTHHKTDGGIVLTTAESASQEFEDRREALEAELGIDIRLITMDELTELIMTHLGAEPLPNNYPGGN